MKFHGPITDLPARQAGKPYQPLRSEMRRGAYVAAKRVHGKWLPVECDSYKDALYLANGARSHSRWRFEAEQRGTMCYLRFIGRVGAFEPIHPTSGEIEAARTHERIGA